MSIKIENLTHVYMPKSPFEKKALDNVNLVIEDGEFLALIGHTGSGKSTLIQHLNGLLEPTSGRILVDDIDITNKEAKLTEIRKKIGLVFQYPEYQLFEETIEKDIAFGPNNLELSSEEVSRRVKKSMEMVGLDYETYKNVSPFDLSGGQKRRVAIAGVIAMEPKVLILDEPTAGLDPQGRDDVLEQIKLLHEKYKMTIVLVSHSMEDVGKLAQRIVVMNKGKVELLGKPSEVLMKSNTKIQEIKASECRLTEQFSFAVKNDRIAISLLTLDGKNLKESGHLLISAIGRSGMDGAVYEKMPDSPEYSETDVTRISKEGKLYLETLEGTLYVEGEGIVSMYALDVYGSRIRKYEVKSEGTRKIIVLDGDSYGNFELIIAKE